MRGLLALLLLLMGGAAPGALAEATRPIPLVLDLEPAGDYDDLPTLLAAAVSPEFDLLGVIVGGGLAEAGERVATQALSLVGREDVALYRGLIPDAEPPPFDYWAQFPRRRWAQWPRTERFAKDFEVKPDPGDGVAFYLDAAARHPGELTIITGSVLTTLAEAMREADRRGQGEHFRRSIRQILISGGDFGTSEWNVYMDMPAAERVLASGVPLFLFGGEDRPKARLRHADRVTLWRQETPLTWALQDFYRLYGAGYDPTSPFVPTMYDTHPLAFLLEGERISELEPMAVAVGPEGHLVRNEGVPNVQVRVVNHPDRLLAWLVERLSARVEPAAHHLRSIGRLAGAEQGDLLAALREAERGIRALEAVDPEGLERILAPVDARVEALGPRADKARWHLAMVRAFLLGEPREDPWQDPYTDGWIRLWVVWKTLPKRKIAAAGLVGGAVALVGWLAVRRRGARAGGSA